MPVESNKIYRLGLYIFFFISFFYYFIFSCISKCTDPPRLEGKTWFFISEFEKNFCIVTCVLMTTVKPSSRKRMLLILAHMCIALATCQACPGCFTSMS